MSKLTTTKNARQNEIMTLADKEQELSKSKELLTKVKENPNERAKVKVEIHDKYNTIFFLSLSKANNREYIDGLIRRVNNQY